VGLSGSQEILSIPSASRASTTYSKNRALQRRREYLTTERLERERQSLAYAHSRADLIVNTEGRSQQAVLEYVVDALEAEGIDRISWEPERPTENWGDVD
jgi:predicted dinucleotide-utilizing enzyme